MGMHSAWGINKSERQLTFTRAVNLSASWRCNGIAQMTGVLEWVDTDSLGRTGGKHKEDVSFSMSVISRRALDLQLGMGDQLTYVILHFSNY